MSPALQRMIPQMVDCIVVGEGYDVIRGLFKSSYNVRGAEGITCLADGTVLSARLDDVAGLSRKAGVTIVYSQQTEPEGVLTIVCSVKEVECLAHWCDHTA